MEKLKAVSAFEKWGLASGAPETIDYCGKEDITNIDKSLN